MLGLGLASSHVGMKETPKSWKFTLEARLSNYPELREYLPLQLNQETDEKMEEYRQRVAVAYASMRQQVEHYRPDALIVIGDDQYEIFDHSNVPVLAICSGDQLWGLERLPYGEDGERKRMEYKTNPELARHIATELVKRDFDISSIVTLKPRGGSDSGLGSAAGTKREERGLGHMVVGVVPMVDPDYEIPIIPIYISEYFNHYEDYYLPLPSADRCYRLGMALADILRARPERVAIYASGGLSHPASGGAGDRRKGGGLPNNLPLGYVDEVLDRWFLDCLERNDSDSLRKLFVVESETVLAGTGELRAWITVAGAMNCPATVLDYIPHWHQVCGLGYAYWRP